MQVKKYIDKIILVIIAIIFIIMGYFNNKKKDSLDFVKINESKLETKLEIETKFDNIVDEKQNKDIYVHISGCVLNQGVYKLEYGSRLFQLIELAGGLCEDVDYNTVNLSKILKDEMNVHIYKKNEKKISDINTDEYSINENKVGLININTANLEELKQLPGVGDSKAKEIIEYRKQSKFEKIEDIMNISGIGEKSFEKIKEKITVD